MDEVLLNWIGGIILVLILVFGIPFGITYMQDHETLREQCFDDCVNTRYEDRVNCIDQCFELENGNVQKYVYSKNLIQEVQK